MEDGPAYGEGLSFGTRFRLWLRKINLWLWTIALNLSGWVILSLGLMVNSYWESSIQEVVVNLSMSVAFLIWGFMGFLWALRRQIPHSFRSERGNGAFIMGALMMIVFWGMSAKLIIATFNKLLMPH